MLHKRAVEAVKNRRRILTGDADPWVELYTTNLGKRIKQMPINRVTEQILNKINDYFAKQKAKEEEISEQEVFNLLSSQERDYLFKDSTGTFEKGELEAADIYTKDPLTEKGKEILAAMKEQYGEEEGEKIFYASKNKGTIEGVDSQIKDATPSQVRRIEELNTAIKAQRLAGHTKDAERLEEELGKELGKMNNDAAPFDLKSLSDEELMDLYSKIESMREPNPDNEDQRQADLLRIKNEIKSRGFSTRDYRGYKTTDQIYKGFMIYKSGKNPARFTLKNESGITYEGSLEDAKKQVDEYWNRRDEEVVNQKLQGDSQTKDAAGLKPRMTSVFGKYQVINSEGDIVGTFAAKYEAEEVLRNLIEQWKRKRAQKDSQTKDENDIINRVSSQIESEKRKLRGERIVENFGQDIVRKLRDHFDYNKLRYGSPKERIAAGLIDAFDDWCSSYTGDQDFSISVNSVLKQRLKKVASNLRNNRLGLGPGGDRQDGSGLVKGGNGKQSAGLGGRKQLQGDAETTIFSQQGYKIVKLNNGMYAVSGPTIPSNEKGEFYSPDIARAFIVERMKRDGVYGKFGKDAARETSIKYKGWNISIDDYGFFIIQDPDYHYKGKESSFEKAKKLVDKLTDARTRDGAIITQRNLRGITYTIKESDGPGYIGESNLDDEVFEGMNATRIEKDLIDYIKSKTGYKDAVNHMGEKEYQTYEAWKRACKQANPSVRFEGDKDICNALPNVGEWDGATGVVYNKEG